VEQSTKNNTGAVNSTGPARRPGHWAEPVVLAWGIMEVSVVALVAFGLISGWPLAAVIRQLTGNHHAPWWALGIGSGVFWVGDLATLPLLRLINVAETAPNAPHPVSWSRLAFHLVPGLPVLHRMLTAVGWIVVQVTYLIFILVWDVLVVLLSLPLKLHGPFSRSFGRLTDVVDRFRERILAGLDRAYRATAAFT
jgi:hypothetical protein